MEETVLCYQIVLKSNSLETVNAMHIKGRINKKGAKAKSKNKKKC